MTNEVETTAAAPTATPPPLPQLKIVEVDLKSGKHIKLQSLDGKKQRYIDRLAPSTAGEIIVAENRALASIVEIDGSAVKSPSNMDELDALSSRFKGRELNNLTDQWSQFFTVDFDPGEEIAKMESSGIYAVIAKSSGRSFKMYELNGREQRRADELYPPGSHQVLIGENRALFSLREIDGHIILPPINLAQLDILSQHVTGCELDELTTKWAQLFTDVLEEASAKNS